LQEKCDADTMRSAIKCGGNVLANLDAKEVFLNAVPHVERQRPI
jgi:hypothetical protein